MSEYQNNTTTVISRLKERSYSDLSIRNYEKIFSSISIYLDSKGWYIVLSLAKKCSKKMMILSLR